MYLEWIKKKKHHKILAAYLLHDLLNGSLYKYVCTSKQNVCPQFRICFIVHTPFIAGIRKVFPVKMTENAISMKHTSVLYMCI